MTTWSRWRSADGPGDESIPIVTEVDFAHDARQLVFVAGGDMTERKVVETQRFEVTEAQLFHFVLSTSDGDFPDEIGLRFSIVDEAGRIVFHDDGPRRRLAEQGMSSLVLAAIPCALR